MLERLAESQQDRAAECFQGAAQGTPAALQDSLRIAVHPEARPDSHQGIRNRLERIVRPERVGRILHLRVGGEIEQRDAGLVDREVGHILQPDADDERPGRPGIALVVAGEPRVEGRRIEGRRGGERRDRRRRDLEDHLHRAGTEDMHRLARLEGPVHRGVGERLEVLNVELDLRDVVPFLVAAHDPIGRLVLPAGNVGQIVGQRLGGAGTGDREAVGDLERSGRPMEHERGVRGIDHVEIDVEEFLEEARLAGDHQVGERPRLRRSGELLGDDHRAAICAQVDAPEVRAATAAATATATATTTAATTTVDALTGIVEVQGDRDRLAAHNAEHDLGLELVDVLVVWCAHVDAGGQDLGQGEPLHGDFTLDEILPLQLDDVERISDPRLHLLRDRPVAVLVQVEEVGAGINDKANVAADRLPLNRVLGVDLDQGRHAIERLVIGSVEHGDAQVAANHRGELPIGEGQRTNRARFIEEDLLRVRRVVPGQVGNRNRGLTQAQLEGEGPQRVGGGRAGKRAAGFDCHPGHRPPLAVFHPAAHDRVSVLKENAAAVELAGDRDRLPGGLQISSEAVADERDAAGRRWNGEAPVRMAQCREEVAVVVDVLDLGPGNREALLVHRETADAAETQVLQRRNPAILADREGRDLLRPGCREALEPAGVHDRVADRRGQLEDPGRVGGPFLASRPTGDQDGDTGDRVPGPIDDGPGQHRVAIGKVDAVQPLLRHGHGQRPRRRPLVAVQPDRLQRHRRPVRKDGRLDLVGTGRIRGRDVPVSIGTARDHRPHERVPQAVKQVAAY